MTTRTGLAALACSLAHTGFAFWGKQAFLHLGPVPALEPPQVLRELLAGAVLLVGASCGALAVRRSRGRDWAAVAALALATPFVIDVAVAPLTRLLANAPAGRWIFIGATEAALLLLLVATARARRATSPAARSGEQDAARTPPPPGRSGAWLARVAVLAGALLVALLLGEGLARAAGLGPRRYARPMLLVPGDERRVPLAEVALFRPFGLTSEQVGLSARFRPYLFLKGWYDRPVWPYFDESGCVDYVFNRYGLRDHDFELEKAPGELRVVAIGDSFTFGVGVQLDDCWTEVLERGLRERRGGAVEVINAGFASGYDPRGYEEWIARDGVSLQPDVVAIGLCLNDLHTGIPLLADEPPEKYAQWLGGRSSLLNAVQAGLRGRPQQPWQAGDYAALVRAEPEGWSEVQQSLRRTQALLAAQGIRLLVVPLPMLSGLRRDYPYAEILAMVSEFCDAEGLERVDLLPRFVGQDERALWVHATDQHPNDRGQRLIGEGVLDYLAPR